MRLPSTKKMAFLGFAIGVISALVLLALFFGAPLFPGWQAKGEEQGEGPITIEFKKIELIELKVRDCDQCLSFDLFRQQLLDLNREFELKELDFESDEGKELIEKYSIGTVPTIILRNAPADLFGNWNEVGSIEEDGAMVFRSKVPVYWDLEEEKFIGLVSITQLVDSSCTECSNPLESNEMLALLANIRVKEINAVEIDSAEGKALLRKYFLDFAPAVVFSMEIRDYNFFEQFAPLGSVESDGSFVVRKKLPAFKDLDSNTVKGRLSITLIEPTQCWACKDARDMLEFLNTNLGLRFSNINVIDANSENARFLSEQYAIQFAPAALISGDLMLYQGMEETWPQIGRVFKDGVFALDNPLLLGEGYYFDFNTGQIITVSAQAP